MGKLEEKSESDNYGIGRHGDFVQTIFCIAGSVV